MKYVLLLAIATAQFTAAETLQVKRLKRFWWDGQGQIEITEDAISYKAKKPKDSRTWKYQDIQYFDRISPKEFVILSYEDVGWQLGRDREFHFVITSEELSDALFGRITRRLNRPVTNRVIGKAAAAKYELPVKHEHTFGGCEGVLRFTDDSISYATDHKEDAREWLIARDVQSVWSMHPYGLEVHVYDNNRREFSRTRVYKFDLKQPLDPEFYRALKLKLYNLETTHLVMR